ncbi:MAG: hypothetical protein R8M11_09300 [Gallionella sp.]
MTRKTNLIFLVSMVALMSGSGLQAEPQPSGEQSNSRSSRGMVLQKMQLVKMMMSSTSSIERAAQSKNTVLNKRVSTVQAFYVSANDALNSGDISKADELADEALKAIEELSRVAPDPKKLEAEFRTRYKESLEYLRSAEATYLDLRERVATNKKGSHYALDEIQKKRVNAKSLAREGNYQEASEMLNDAHAEVIEALNKLLGSKALTYEVTFKNDIEEYDYELARYHSFEELAPIAYVELKPDKNTIALSERYVQKSRDLRDTAKELAAKGEHRVAIDTLFDAMKGIKTALRIVGLVLQD